MFRAYAQNGEDALLHRCFPDVTDGFYVDVGANSPVIDSVTLAFYERGWRGVNVEPLPWRFRELQRYRPRDVNVHAACGRTERRRTLYATPGLGGLSSLSETQAAEGAPAPVPVEVDGTTLRALFSAHAPPTIHFLKIDVEGAEREVLAGNDWTRFRPTVVVIEATKPNSPERNAQAWAGLLRKAHYRLAYFDGLNDYYLSDEQAALRTRFATPLSVFDGVERFDRFGHPFDDRRHPDHAWARALASRYLAAGTLLGPEADVVALTADLAPGTLERPPLPDDVRIACARALGHEPGARDAETCAGAATVRELYSLLVRCDAFLIRRARAVPTV